MRGDERLRQYKYMQIHVEMDDFKGLTSPSAYARVFVCYTNFSIT